MGVGFGWNRSEFEDHGLAGDSRRELVEEKIALMKALWTEEVATYEGKHLTLGPSWAWPKPFQQPHPLILLGGSPSQRTFRRIASWADGWIPMSVSPLSTLKDDLARLKEEWDKEGRPSDPHITVMQALGPVEELRQQIEQYRELGVDRVLIDIPSEPTPTVLPILKSAAQAIT
jgi:alkanesulfonate monooxygenase SsuD/methylene tetrahydromethanopterin reductase-like flavin-dependent oxidoreductase (luciferase family)